MRFARSVSSQRSSGSSQTGTSSLRPDAGDGGAHVDATERRPSLVEQALDVLPRTVRSAWATRSSAELFRHRAGALFASVVVDEHVRALGRERASTRRADAAGGTR